MGGCEGEEGGESELGDKGATGGTGSGLGVGCVVSDEEETRKGGRDESVVCRRPGSEERYGAREVMRGFLERMICRRKDRNGGVSAREIRMEGRRNQSVGVRTATERYTTATGLWLRRKSNSSWTIGNESTSCEKRVRSHERAKNGRGVALRGPRGESADWDAEASSRPWTCGLTG